MQKKKKTDVKNKSVCTWAVRSLVNKILTKLSWKEPQMTCLLPFTLSEVKTKDWNSTMGWEKNKQRITRTKTKVENIWQAGSNFSHLLPNITRMVHLNSSTDCKTMLISPFTLTWDPPGERVVKYQCVDSGVSNFHLSSDSFLMRIAAGHWNKNLEFNTNQTETCYLTY